MTVVYKSRGPSEEPLSVLEFLIGDHRVEGVIPERGGDSETWGKKLKKTGWDILKKNSL